MDSITSRDAVSKSPRKRKKGVGCCPFQGNMYGPFIAHVIHVIQGETGKKTDPIEMAITSTRSMYTSIRVSNEWAKFGWERRESLFSSFHGRCVTMKKGKEEVK